MTPLGFLEARSVWTHFEVAPWLAMSDGLGFGAIGGKLCEESITGTKENLELKQAH